MRNEKSYSSVFELEGFPPFTQFWSVGISRWLINYRGLAEEKAACPTVANEKKTRVKARFNIVQAVASELANAVTAEGLDVTLSHPSEAATESLNAYLAEILERVSFEQSLSRLIEQTIAVGGGAISVWADGDRDENGEVVANPRIELNFFQANDFIPLKWTNSRIDACALISHEARGGKYYTRIEEHRQRGEGYSITNRLFESPSNAILGQECPISTIYAMAAETDFIVPIRGLVSYFANPRQNNIDFNSPLGISLFAGAEDIMRALNTAFDSFGREFVLGRKRVLVPSACIQTVRDREGNEHRYFNADDEAYEVLFCDNPEGLKIQDNTVSLRVDEHVRAINALLDLLAFQVGVSQGSFSFDQARGIKTATEVASENAKTYRFVKKTQSAVSSAVKRTVEGILRLSAALGIRTKEGFDIARMVSEGVEISVSFRDGIVQDDSERRRDGIALVNAGLISKRTFLVDYLHYAPEEAERELERVKAEMPEMPSIGSLFEA